MINQMDYEMFKKLTKIRLLMDENPKKAKQLVTDLLKKFEQERKLFWVMI